MDRELLALAGVDLAAQRRVPELNLRRPAGLPVVEVETSAGTRQYTLKPLKDLYDQGTGLESIDLKTPEIVPLYVTIEEEVLLFNRDDAPTLTDGAVLLIVKQMGMDPDHEPADPLGRQIHLALRVNLSLNNYSRQDVKAALRQIAKSIERHTRTSGVRGYLAFLREFFKR